jgi:xanthine dehydrogenase YagT iron-sulfur-binding subunit
MSFNDDFTRRQAIAMGGAVAAVPALTPLQALARDAGSPAIPVKLRVNGKAHELQLEPRATLLDTLRERLKLFGTKKGCDIGQCGACTVHVDGQRVLSCLTLAAQVSDRQVTTIEGIARSDADLHPMQQAFLDNDALQCGYCTPGQIMSGIACVREGHAGSEDEIREYMSGNLCRCGAYRGIVAAIAQVSRVKP